MIMQGKSESGKYGEMEILRRHISTIRAGALSRRHNYFEPVTFNPEYLTTNVSTTFSGTGSKSKVAAACGTMRKKAGEVQKREDDKKRVCMHELLQENEIDVHLKPVLNIIAIKTRGAQRICDGLKPKCAIGFNNYCNLPRIAVMQDLKGGVRRK